MPWAEQGMAIDFMTEQACKSAIWGNPYSCFYSKQTHVHACLVDHLDFTYGGVIHFLYIVHYSR